MITKQQALSELPKIEEKRLYAAVEMALWLLIDKKASLRHSIDTAAKKHSYKPKSEIERYVKLALPNSFLMLEK